MAVIDRGGDGGSDWPAQGGPNGILVPQALSGAQIVTAVAVLLDAADPVS